MSVLYSVYFRSDPAAPADCMPTIADCSRPVSAPEPLALSMQGGAPPTRSAAQIQLLKIVYI